ncbi:MAG: hypothetical protein LBG10_10205, partial [Treponema sp.]|nr:hypothetical protein [Treponema sp.]
LRYLRYAPAGNSKCFSRPFPRPPGHIHVKRGSVTLKNRGTGSLYCKKNGLCAAVAVFVVFVKRQYH